MEEKDKLRSFYDNVSSYLDIGSYDDFYGAMQDPSRRQKFFDSTSQYVDIGDSDKFNQFVGDYFGQQQPAPRVDVSDVEAQQQPQVPTVTMEQVDNEPQQPYGDLTAENFVTMQQRGKELADQRKRIQRELDNDTEMEPLTASQRKEYESQLRGLDEEMRGVSSWIDEWNKTEGARAYYEQQKRAVNDVSTRIDQMQADRNRERISKRVEEDNKKSWWQRMAEGLASAENPITEEVVEAITDTNNNDLRAARNEVRNAKNQLRLEEMRQNGEQRGLGFLRGMENANYYELMPAIGMADAMSILQLSQDIKDGKELTDSQKLLKEAMEARAGVDFAYQDNNTLWERIGQSAPEQLMFTLQFVVGAGVTGATKVGEKVAAKSAEKAVKRLAKKEATSAARNFVATRVVPELEGMAVSSAIQTFANPLSVAGMVEDFERRYAGDIYYDKQGNLHVFDNDRSAGQAAYQAIASAWIENFTEYAGGNITKSAKLLDSKMFDLAGKFDNVMKTVGAGKIQDVFRIPQQLGRLTQIGSAPEEFLEEELGSVMNALMATDAQRGESYGEAFKNTISSSFAGEQQLETFLSCAITSMLLGGGGNAVNGVRNAGLRKSVNQDVEQSKALLGKVRGVDIEGLDNMIENGRVSDISAYLKEQSDANNWNKDEQGAAVSYVLNRSRQIGVKHNDDTAIEAEQAEYRRQAEDMVNRWDGQNIYNVTYTDRNGETQEGTIVNGRVHYNANEDGTYTFDPYMSSGMLAIRRDDGSVEQVAGRNVTALNNVATIEEQLESQNQTIDQLMRAEFDQDGMLPTIDSVWGVNLVPNVTQFQNGRYTYLEQDDNGLYAFANNDKRTSKDNPIVYLTERQLIEYGLSLNLENAQANGDTEAAQKAQDDIDFLKRLDEITADAGAKGQWDVVKAYAQKNVQLDANGDIIPDGSNEQATAAYLLAISEGSFENAIASVDQTIAALGTPQQTEVTDNAADNAAMNNAAATVDADKARQIDFYTNVRNRLTEMQQGKEESDQEEAEQVVANTPVSQMEVGQQFPVEWRGQQAMATVMGKDADGRSVVTVRDMDGEDIEAGIDDMSDAQWEAVRVQPQEATAPEQVPPQVPQQVEPQQEVPQAASQSEPQPQQEAQQEPRLPRDKDGNIDYEQITDPALYAQGLLEEFGDEAIDTINDLINEEMEALAKAGEKKNAIERRRAQKESQGKLDFYYKVKDALTPQEQVETPTEEAAPVEEAPIEQPVAETPVEEAQPEQAPEQEATEESEPIAEETIEEQPSKPTEKEDSEFQKRIAAVGEPRNLEEAILMDIALGGAKFRWGNRNEDKKVLKRGIGDLWKYDNKEFRKRIGIVKKDGFSIETYAEAILAGQLQPYSGAVSQQAEGMDFQDIVAAIEDVLQMVTSKTGALQAIEENRQAEAEEEQRYIRSLQDKEARDMGFEDWEDYENYQKSLEENNLTDDDYEEINRIFAEQTQEEDEQRARTSESEGDTAANQSDEQQGVRGESEGGTGVLQGTQVTDTGATEPTGQSTRSESGDTTNAAPQGEGADEVRAEIDRLKAQRASIVSQRDEIQQRYEQANGLFGDTQADENDLFGGQSFLSPELAQATIDGYNRQIKQIDEQIAKLEASLKRAEGVTQTEIEEAAEVAPADGGNTIFTEDEKDRRIEALKRRHRSQLNIAIDPQDLGDMLYVAGYHIEKGIRKFADFCKNMIEDLGDWVRPYLKQVYQAAKYDEDIKKLNVNRKEWSSEEEVDDFDVDNFDKQSQSTSKQDDFIATVEQRMADGNQININVLRALASSLEMGDVKDTELQEMTERAIINMAKRLVAEGKNEKETFDSIVKLYNAQPTISMRSSERIEKQQYSTPIPIAYLADMFVKNGLGNGIVLEPSAGNGMMVFGLPSAQVEVNEIDPVRARMLVGQGFRNITMKDGRQPFDGKYDGIVTNPPFGSSPEINVDGVPISGLEEQMVINALNAMKDDGKAAIIIGGHTKYTNFGALASQKGFFNYLYSRYNVVDVINVNGDLYTKQGTKYPVRLILIDGRKSDEQRIKEAANAKGGKVLAPVKQNARAEVVNTFEELYNRVSDDIQNQGQRQRTEADKQQDKPSERTGDATNGNTQQPGRNGESVRGDGVLSNPSVQPNMGGVATSTGRSEGSETEVNDKTDSGEPDGKPASPRVSATQQRNETGAGEREGGNSTDTQQRTERDADTGRTGLGRGASQLETQKKVQVNIGDEKVAYPKQSKSNDVGTVVPAAQAQALGKVLSDFGDIDQFVQDELGYSSKEEMYNALSAEQVDGVALAIKKAKEGKALIIGDETGIGKGRQAAAMIRWAVRQGKKPVFVTEKPDLFSDIYRDLVDIGSGDLVPFIVNAREAKSNITDNDGNVVYKGSTPEELKRVEDYVDNYRTLPDGYDFAVVTYSQLQDGTMDYEDGNKKARSYGKKQPSAQTLKNKQAAQAKRDMIEKLAKDNYIVMDEAHNAAGTNGGGAMFWRFVVPQTKAVTFLSATFAKRPENMPIFALKTSISEANVSPEELIQAIEQGGVTLQEIMSKGLVENGEMVRRAKSFEGVTVDWLPMKGDTKTAKEKYNTTIELFNDIIQFQREFIDPIVNGINEEIAEMQEELGHKKGTANMGVTNTPFASKTFNLVRQIILMSKVEEAADMAIEEFKAGRKPLIALDNTMEGFMNEAFAGLDSDGAEEPDFSLVFKKGLDGVFRMTRKDSNGNESDEVIRLSDLPKEGQERYHELVEKINKTSVGLSISPIDAIKRKMTEAGLRVGELTGRHTEMVYNEDGTVKVQNRRDRDKKKIMREFNNGDIDAIIINKSSSTGVSLHSNKKFKDQKPRTMIIAQSQLDVNGEVQMRGRINRTGQVNLPKYIYIVSPVPAEGRLTMMLKHKLASLDANTTSSQKSKQNEIDIVDFLNKYGDKVVVEWLKDNMDMVDKLLDPFKWNDKGEDEIEKYEGVEGDASKLASRVALLTTEEQERFYQEVSERYTAYIDYLNGIGQNDLEITTMPLNAELKSSEVLVSGKNPGGGNVFADNANLERYEVDVLRKPMRASEVKKQMEQLTDGLDKYEYRDKLREQLNAATQKKLDELQAEQDEATKEAQEKAEAKLRKLAEKKPENYPEADMPAFIHSVRTTAEDEVAKKFEKRMAKINRNRTNMDFVFRNVPVGRVVSVPVGKKGDARFYTQGMLMGYKVKGDSMNPSSVTAVFATLDSRRRVEIPLSMTEDFEALVRDSQFNMGELGRITLDNWDSIVPDKQRKEVYIITGNIIQAMSTANEGQLISFTTNDGEIKQGILMPDKWEKKNAKKRTKINDPKILEALEGDTVIKSSDGQVTIEKNRQRWYSVGYVIRVPKSKQTGGKYFLDEGLRSLVKNADFYQSGGFMVGDIVDGNLKAVLDYLAEHFDMTTDVKAFEDEQHGDGEVMYRNQEREYEFGETLPIKKDADGRYRVEGLNDSYPNLDRLLDAWRDEHLDYFAEIRNGKLYIEPWNLPEPKTAKEKRYLQKSRERAWRNMHTKADDTIKKLGLQDRVTILDSTDGLEGKKKTAKGWFDPATGKIVIVMPNHRDPHDVMKTILHEGVAHYGLRQLVGNDNMNEFLDKVFEHASKDVRDRIIDLAMNKYNRNIRKATEEYLAGLAESTNFEDATEKDWFKKIKGWFMQMLHKVGIDFGNFGEAVDNATFWGDRFTDNELRYLLWKSYRNLVANAESRTELARDVMMQSQLGVGNYAPQTVAAESMAREDNDDDFDPDDNGGGVMFRDGEPANEIADEYNRETGANVSGVNAVKRGWEKFARDMFDGLRPLEQMQKLIEKALGRKLRDSEKAYELATQLTSKTGQQIDREQLSYMVPVLQQVTDVIKALKDADGYSLDEAYEKVTNYMLAKHGLERNEWFKKQGKDEGDYAGLRGLAERLGYNPDDYKTAAEVTVKDMEDTMKAAGIDVKEFWKTVNALTNRMLEISYESGMIDKDTFEDLKKRHKYYVPLRGFAEGTAADLFDYVTQSPHFQNIFQKAKGRKSMADDPLANLMSMLQSSIVIGNQNQVMQKIYNLAVNSNSDLLRVTKPWYVYNDATNTWEEKYPDIPEDATADEIDAIMKQFDADMAKLKANGKAKRKYNRIDVGKKLLRYQAKEHEMVAYIDGQRVLMHVAGNPLVAQSMNRMNAQHLNKVMQGIQAVTRWYSAINTSWSPAFGPKNAARDIRMMLFGAYTTGGIKKMWQSARDIVKAGWALPRLLITGKMDGGLVKALGKQKAAQLEQWWNEFLDNGGETGFTRTLNAEKAKGEVKDMIRHMLNGSKDGENRVRKYTIGLIEWIGRYSEDISRFAAYCQQRAQGESVLSSINEAKNVTVNFNVKGGGDLAANMRAMYSFFNASMQGINRMRRLATEHPGRFSAGIAAMMLGGAVLPWLNMAMFAMLGGDDDDWRKYEELTEYTANHNMILYVGNHKFISIPWSQELAPFNALGNIWFRQQMGWNKGRSVAEQWGDMFVDLSPISVASGNKPGVGLVKTIMPSFTTPIWESLFNEDFTGSPLYKDNQWNKYDAAWEKAYTGKTSQSVIDASRWLNEKTDIDINPAIAEHLFSGVLGGMGRSGDKLLRYFTNGFQLQDAPFIRTMMFDSKKQGYIGAVQREYGRNAYDVLPKVKHDVDDMDAMEFAQFSQTEEFEIANLVSVYKTGKDLAGNKKGIVGIDAMEKEYKKIAGASDGSEEYREQLEEIRSSITERKMEMLDEIQQIKYEHSGDLRKRIIDRVNEVEQESKEKNARKNGKEK